jgi:putative nucleotide binding protein
MMAEDNAIVLDFLPKGKPSAPGSGPVVQLLGVEHFTLLEAVPKPGATMDVGDKVFIGKENREKIELIKGRINYKSLTSDSVSELEGLLVSLVAGNKQKYLDFFNNSKPISLMRHSVELLPGMGKKHVLAFLGERDKKKFDSFEEMQSRVKGFPDPIKSVVKRILEELEGPEDKHYLFVRPPAEPKPFRRY